MNATHVMDDSEITLTTTTVNCTKKVNLLRKFALFLDIDVNDCLMDVDISLIYIQKNSLDKFKQCILAVMDEANEFAKDTITELKHYYFLTFSIANNLQNCIDLTCIEKMLSPLTQLANDGMIAINNLSGNTVDLVYHMNRSFNQCYIGYIQLGISKIDAIANAVATCINDKVTAAN